MSINILDMLGMPYPTGRWYLLPNEVIKRASGALFDDKQKFRPVVVLRDFRHERVWVLARSASSFNGEHHSRHSHGSSDESLHCRITKDGRVLMDRLQVDRGQLGPKVESCDEPKGSHLRVLLSGMCHVEE